MLFFYCELDKFQYFDIQCESIQSKKFISCLLSQMEKLRSSYSKHQTEVFMANPRLVSSERAAKLTQLANRQIQQMTRRQDFKDLDEATFYKQKFSQLAEVAARLQTKQMTEQRYHKSVREIMQNNYLANPKQTINIARQNVNRRRSKSPLSEFFEQEQIKKSKAISFNKLLSQQQTPLKYKLRSVSRPKSPINLQKNDQEIRLLEEQNRMLREKINKEKNINTQDQARLRELRDRLRDLNQQNRRLKSEISRSQKSEYKVQQEYDPYNIKVRQNNIVKIHSKNLYISEKMSQLGSGLSEDFNMQRKPFKVYYDNQSENIRSQITPKSNSPIRKSNTYIEPQQILNTSQSTIQTQFLNLQDSELYDDDKNQLCRQKIAFFKKSMVLVKSPDFDIAFKRSDFNYQMDKLRLILYLNNKNTRRYDCSIEYQYERQDYEIMVRRRLSEVNQRSQGREQIQISLKNPSDLGSSVINAKVMIGGKIKKVLVPALFIDFDPDYKYQFENVGYLERNLAQPLVIKPMSQFNTIDRASNVLQMVRDYQQKYEVAKLYGKSKACKGVLKLTWKKGKLKIQTCEQWRTLIGFLFLNAQETLTY